MQAAKQLVWNKYGLNKNNPFRCAQVVYEDDDLLAVSKPPFVSTAPRHRWEVSFSYLDGHHSTAAGFRQDLVVSTISGNCGSAVQGGSLVNRVYGYLGELSCLQPIGQCSTYAIWSTAHMALGLMKALKRLLCNLSIAV